MHFYTFLLLLLSHWFFVLSLSISLSCHLTFSSIPLTELSLSRQRLLKWTIGAVCIAHAISKYAYWLARTFTSQPHNHNEYERNRAKRTAICFELGFYSDRIFMHIQAKNWFALWIMIYLFIYFFKAVGKSRNSGNSYLQ